MLVSGIQVGRGGAYFPYLSDRPGNPPGAQNKSGHVPERQ